MNAAFDVVVLGSGFAGSLMAMVLRRLGRTVLLVERGVHPRFAIGESSTPLANLLLEELSCRYDLPRLLPLCKWGAWQETYPQIACGLKRGFTFYRHTLDQPFADDARHQHQLLVAASPRAAIADTHWYREDFDAFLVAEAQRLNVDYLDQTSVREVSLEAEGARITLLRGGITHSLRARFMIDATGPRGVLHQSLALPEYEMAGFPATQALFSHFRGVERWEDLYPTNEPPPFAPDDAAVHHLFAGGWIWVLRFNHGVISAGVAAVDPFARALEFGRGRAAWEQLLERLPSLRATFARAEPVQPFFHRQRLSFHSGRAAGPAWALLPSAAAFVDPLLSTGFPLTLQGIARLALVFEEAWGRSEFTDRLVAYEQSTLAEAQLAAELVAALYAAFDDFELFVPLALLYFAAASFTETARRLGKPELARGFLLGEQEFGRALRDCARRARAWPPPANDARRKLIGDIYAVLEPIDVAGLGDRSRRNWHPVRAEDLFQSRAKLAADEGDVTRMLQRTGFAG